MGSDDPSHADSPTPPADRRRRARRARAAGCARSRRRSDGAPIAASSSRSIRARSCCARSTGGRHLLDRAAAPSCASTAPARRSPTFVPGSSPASCTTPGPHALVIAAFGAPVDHHRPRRRDGDLEDRDHAARRGRRQPSPSRSMPARASSSTARRRDAQLARPGAQVAVTHAADGAGNGRQRAQARGGVTGGGSARGGTILLVEDEEDIATLVRTYLEKDGFRVIWATRGVEGAAGARAERHPPRDPRPAAPGRRRPRPLPGDPRAAPGCRS